jgi:hypothetical protein
VTDVRQRGASARGFDTDQREHKHPPDATLVFALVRAELSPAVSRPPPDVV